VFGFARSLKPSLRRLHGFGMRHSCQFVRQLDSDGFARTAAGLTAGLMSTVWLSATETEVYAVTLLFGCMILWAADRAGQNSDARWHSSPPIWRDWDGRCI